MPPKKKDKTEVRQSFLKSYGKKRETKTVDKRKAKGIRKR